MMGSLLPTKLRSVYIVYYLLYRYTLHTDLKLYAYCLKTRGLRFDLRCKYLTRFIGVNAPKILYL